jgi:hypothetical protein
VRPAARVIGREGELEPEGTLQAAHCRVQPSPAAVEAAQIVERDRPQPVPLGGVWDGCRAPSEGLGAAQ